MRTRPRFLPHADGVSVSALVDAQGPTRCRSPGQRQWPVARPRFQGACIRLGELTAGSSTQAAVPRRARAADGGTMTRTRGRGTIRSPVNAPFRPGFRSLGGRGIQRLASMEPERGARSMHGFACEGACYARRHAIVRNGWYTLMTVPSGKLLASTRFSRSGLGRSLNSGSPVPRATGRITRRYSSINPSLDRA